LRVGDLDRFEQRDQPVMAGWFVIWAKTASGDPGNRIAPSVWSGAAV
jgi:hypothetical protein